MGEVISRAVWAGAGLRSASAGVKPGAKVDPLALAALAELGLSAAPGAAPKAPAAARAALGGGKLSCVVTVCDSAAAEEEACPSFPASAARKIVHAPFADPPKLAREAAAGAAAGGAGGDPMEHYRRVRDEILAWVTEQLPAHIPELARAAPARLQTSGAGAGAASPLSCFERWLTIWVALCMLVGTLIGVYAPAVTAALAQASVYGINIIVTILLWVMITPMFMGIDWASLAAVRHAPGAILLTSTLNFAIKPFTMYALALLFFRVFYAAVVPSADADSYIAGLILLAGAPCTAMVFVWSALLGGDAAYTLVQVATNDLIMLALYVPTACLLIGASNIALPWVTIIISVVLFIVVPLAAAAAARFAVLRVRDEAWLKSRVIDRAKPACIAALLGTLVLIFVFQGAKIAAHPLDILLLAVPIVCQCALLWAMCYAAGWATCVPHARLAPASLIATSNFFELAVAVAISVYGLDSGAALATVVGVLVEVPAMLCLVYVCRWWKPALDARCAACATVCPAAERISSAATDAVCCTASGGARRRGALLSARDVTVVNAAAATAIQKATADAKAARTADAGRSSG